MLLQKTLPSFVFTTQMLTTALFPSMPPVAVGLKLQAETAETARHHADQCPFMKSATIISCQMPISINRAPQPAGWWDDGFLPWPPPSSSSSICRIALDEFLPFYFMPERRPASLFADLLNERDVRVMLRMVDADARDWVPLCIMTATNGAMRFHNIGSSTGLCLIGFNLAHQMEWLVSA